MEISVVIKGGLGNKLFQIAMIMGLQEKYNNSQIKIDLNQFYNKAFHETVDWRYFIRDLQGTFEKQSTTTIINERYQDCFSFIDFNLHTLSSVMFEGYFLSYLYFKNIFSRVQMQFGPTEDAKKYLLDKYQNLSKGYFVHVRRGDFLKQPLHFVGLLENGYFERALRYFSKIEDKHLFVCSDDIEWCRHHPLFMDATFVVEDEIHTLWLMTLCLLGGIGSNSTFSWWGLFLNQSENKIAIMPDKMISDITVPMKDFYPENFIVEKIVV